ncbi:MAG: PilZ domain-containing protein [Candidatus Omnitrophica bacterium]|nr:PilZ domain-containing protein [Candidatus Omnitrophota bacterium]
MSRLRFVTREIGSVKVFDLLGDPSHDSLQEVAWKIQRNIRRHRLQRVILNVQKIKSLDEIGIRKLVAAFLRPQKSGIYGCSGVLMHQLEDTYLPNNMKICPTEKEVAEDFGPFLFHKDDLGKVLGTEEDHLRLPGHHGPAVEMERRRAKRMHVAIPLEMTLLPKGKDSIVTQAIATNISESGIFIEYLDLDALKVVEELDPLEGMKVEVQIHPSGNFPEEYHLEGIIRRREARKRGLGIGVQFTTPT